MDQIWPIDVEKGQAGYQNSDANGEIDDNPDHSAPSSVSTKFSLSKTLSGIGSLRNSWTKRSHDSSKPSELGLANLPACKKYDVVIRQVHETPLGYPRLATFLDSEDIFSVYRRFGYLQSRLLLEKQDDLRRLEKRLDALDMQDTPECQEGLITREVCEDEEPAPQQELLRKIETKFLEYSNLLQASQALMAMNKPTNREHGCVREWLDNAKPVVSPEQDFIHRREDLITLRPGREHAFLDRMIEWVLRKLRYKPITWLFRSKETELKSNGCHGEYYFTRGRIEACANTIICLMILVLLVVPIYILYRLTTNDDEVSAVPTRSGSVSHTNAICIGVLLIGTLAFSAAVSLFTSARRHEILAASAAYCAILVVFIGVNNN